MDQLPKKICSKCKIEKYKFEFHMCKKSVDSVRGVCKECSIAQTKKWMNENLPKNVDPQKNFSGQGY